jgi:hypothetical protein
MVDRRWHNTDPRRRLDRLIAQRMLESLSRYPSARLVDREPMGAAARRSR